MAHLSKKQKLEPSGDSPGDAIKPLPLQRRRVWRACESCRRKKIKCDGHEPTCGQCVSSKATCTWIQTKDRAALSRHYVQELEQRLLHMESLLAKVAGQSQQGEAHSDINGENVAGPASNPEKRDSLTRSPVTPASQRSRNSPQIDVEPVKVKKEDEDEVLVRDQLGQLALDDHGHLRWIGSSSTMSLIQSFRTLISEPLERYSPAEDTLTADSMGNLLYFPPGLGFGKVRALPGPQEVEYPDRDLADKLVATYFEHHHFQLPVLHKPTFLRQYEELMDMSISDRADAGFVSVLFGVFACAARIVVDDRLELESGDGGMAMVYYERAMILYYIGHSNTQLAQVQCFVILASFLCSVNCLPQAWLLVGQALRIAQDLGLHRTPKHLPISAIDKQTRRKVWWSVYTLDRMLAIALGRPLGIDDRDCDAEFPLQVDDEHLQAYLNGQLAPQSTPCPMVGFVALSALFKIGGEVLRGVYSVRSSSIPDSDIEMTTEDLDAQLNDWCERLPPAFKYLPTNEEQTRIGSILASCYYAILITLHRKSLSARRMGRSSQMSVSASASKAVQSARACVRIAPSTKNVIPPSHHMAFFVQFLLTSAVIVLLFAMHAPDEALAASAMSEVQVSLATLQALEGQWPGARKCTELLEGLVEVARGFMNRNGPNPTVSSALLSQGNLGFTESGRTAPLAYREGSNHIGKQPIFKRYDSTPSSIQAGSAAFARPQAIVSEPSLSTGGYETGGIVRETTYSGSQLPGFFTQSSIWSVPSGYDDQTVVQPAPAVDPRFLTYSPPAGSSLNPDTGSAGSTPPLPLPFDTAGLPFAGLDFLHNFTPAAYSGGNEPSMEALWQNIGTGAFNFDPDLQFSLDDSTRVTGNRTSS